MASDDDRSELLDDDALPAEYPPERPLGVNQYGTTAQEERIDEPIEERTRREERAGPPADEPVFLLDETTDGPEPGGELDDGETGSSVLGEVGDAAVAGSDAGPGLGPPSAATAADRVPPSAEEAAMHVVDEDDEDATDMEAR